MSESAQRFVDHLKALGQTNRGAMAALRHSLAFEPGSYEKAYPYVERFASAEQSPRSPWRLALYLTAGLYARHSQNAAQSFAAAFGELWRARDNSPSVEKRFIALLGADAENVAEYLRQAISLLAAEDIGFDFVRLLDDLKYWLNAYAPEQRDRVRQQWARDFYRANISDNATDTNSQEKDD